MMRDTLRGPQVLRGVLCRVALCAAALLLVLLPACTEETDGLQDGYYTARAAEFDNFGWKEYVVICIKDNVIVSVDYDAFNASGFIKSWDMDYMRKMNAVDGTYPNKYVREYVRALLEYQSPAQVEAISGATTSHSTFQLLVGAALEQARTGDSEIALVEVPEAPAH